MSIIKLTRGFETRVDDHLFEELIQFKWYAQGPEGRPARRTISPRKIILFMYHQILGVYPWEIYPKVVDHIDGDPLNNRLDNLRIVSVKENMRNTVRSKFKLGVSVDRTHRTYKAYIDEHDKPRLNIGTYATYEGAANAVAEWRARCGK